MKKVIFTLAFVCIALVSHAQDEDAFKADTREFIALTGAGEAFENVINQLGAMVSEENKVAYINEANGTLDGLYDKMAALYMEEFTHDEVKELITFYNTDLGKKLASKQMLLTQKAMGFGQTWGMELQQIAQKYSN